jgi:hypothetical protein
MTDERDIAVDGSGARNEDYARSCWNVGKSDKGAGERNGFVRTGKRDGVF